ncbi:hypothetical protein AQUCO_11400025v1 [Aquilegia coerulea]|uniref:C2H2-type domain-containing protein n=1 Tax=Aquilegia coerulea TaxID=218851 RepID=A0A2G5C2J5_AQUCA|nr:hypothetical protein AQUCO_11400025v1 [Aquilegia coerulea]
MATFSCIECDDLGGFTEYQMKIHNSECHTYDKIICVECLNVFHSDKALLNHKKQKHDPRVIFTDYQLLDISEDGFVSVLTENGNTKDDLRLPTDDTLCTQIIDGFNEGKDLVVTVMSAMGEEQICALEDIGPE